jgi:cytochrome bd-type quinol oxidase subunit 1
VNDGLFLHRIHFAFTKTFHYLFPQLTIGLAALIVVLKALAIRAGNEILCQEGCDSPKLHTRPNMAWCLVEQV